MEVHQARVIYMDNKRVEIRMMQIFLKGALVQWVRALARCEVQLGRFGRITLTLVL
jgi:hypothetical protein